MSRPGFMHGGVFTAGPWADDPPDPNRDRELAGQAVIYLRNRGLEDEAVIECLRDEFEIDLPTAETMVCPPGRGMDVGPAAR